jgi:NAD(P) transhydrogenase subunit beta
MLIAIVATLLDQHIVSFAWIFAGIVIGGAIGVLAATKVQMSAMPQLVAAFNGFGGAASVLVAAVALLAPETASGVPLLQLSISCALSALIGATTFTGSMVAWAKLQETLKWQPTGATAKIFGVISLLASLACGAYLVYDPTSMPAFWGLVAASSLYGIVLTVPIGGADMPVVIALLNSFSGLAAAATGFVLGNNVLIIAGSLVGASGLILTNIMCRAMNRSIGQVLFAAFGEAAVGPAGAKDDIYQGRVKSTNPDEAAMLFEDARKVIIVPGYGMAVAQAQHSVRDLANLLESRGIEVSYAIHPVAGRMPGHMNVLLAEADVPYDKLFAMEDINSSFSETDVVIVLGANDVVNPAALDDKSSPI